MKPAIYCGRVVLCVVILERVSCASADVKTLPDISCHTGYNPEFRFLVKEQQKLRTWKDAHDNFCNVTHRMECRIHCMARVMGIIDRKLIDMDKYEFYFNSAEYLGNLWKDLFQDPADTEGAGYAKRLAWRVADICKEAMEEVKGNPCQYMMPLFDCLGDHLFCGLNDDIAKGIDKRK